jgi:hypothetical protein
MRTTLDLRAGVDALHLYSPDPAAIEGTLPSRVPTERRDNARLGVYIDALEVSDNLKLLPEEIRKECGFGAGGWIPGCATGGRRQASIALATEGVAYQIRRVTRWHSNGVGNGRDCDLRRGMGDRAEGTCEHESGCEQNPRWRILTGLLMELAHCFDLQMF